MTLSSPLNRGLDCKQVLLHGVPQQIPVVGNHHDRALVILQGNGEGVAHLWSLLYLSLYFVQASSTCGRHVSGVRVLLHQF